MLEEIAGTRAIVFVQDYHYALLPRMVKAARPDAVVCQFWHIPWPNPEAFRILPWQSEVLDGLLGNDLLGFHLQYHCNNFLETVDRSMEARIDQETFSVYCRGHRTAIRPYPISIDPSTWNGTSPGSAWTKEVAATRKRLDVGDRRIVMGVDRLDYTKGIPDRLLAFDRFLERYPEWRGRVVLVQVGSPTRDRIDRYRDLSREVGELVDKINTRHGLPGWIPIVYRREYHTPKDVAALYRATDVCVVSSLHDGMNLVAKEFVASRSRQPRRAAAVEVRGRGPRALRRPAGQPVCAGRVRRRAALGAVDGSRRGRAADAVPAIAGVRPYGLRLGGPHPVATPATWPTEEADGADFGPGRLPGIIPD